MGTGDHNAGGEPGDGLASHPGGAEQQYSLSLHATETGVKGRSDGSLGS